jgi:hypothetical protein
MSAPAKRIAPRDGNTPITALRSVDLPAPLAPITVTISLSAMESVASRTASTEP